jgi:hypothetical protein
LPSSQTHSPQMIGFFNMLASSLNALVGFCRLVLAVAALPVGVICGLFQSLFMFISIVPLSLLVGLLAPVAVIGVIAGGAVIVVYTIAQHIPARLLVARNAAQRTWTIALWCSDVALLGALGVWLLAQEVNDPTQNARRTGGGVSRPTKLILHNDSQLPSPATSGRSSPMSSRTPSVQSFSSRYGADTTPLTPTSPLSTFSIDLHEPEHANTVVLPSEIVTMLQKMSGRDLEVVQHLALEMRAINGTNH